VLDFKSSSISVYGRATLYLVLSLVGDVYIGVQPKYTVALSEDADYGASSGCAVDYTPSATVTVFVGASIDLAQKNPVWSKQANIETFSLPAGSSGCITHAEISSLESWADSVNSWWRRRRLQTYVVDEQATSFFVNYTNPNIAYKREHQWGNAGNVWYGNLSTFTQSANTDFDGVCGKDSAVIPDFGRLMVYPQSNDGAVLKAIYKTRNYNVSLQDSNGNVMLTDLNCVARYEMNRVWSEYNATGIDGKIARYQVMMVDGDYKCDVNESLIEQHEDANIKLKTQLPDTLDAVLLDSAFGSILMHDLENCMVFALSTNTEMNRYELSETDLRLFANASYSWPSKTWFGSFHCDEEMAVNESVTLYLNSIDWLNGDINATLRVNVSRTVTAIGKLNFDDLSLVFRFYDEEVFGSQQPLIASGFVQLLQDGDLVYYGVTPSHEQCTGFIFQGYLDMQQFDEEANVNVEAVSGTEQDGEAVVASNLGVVFVGIGIGAGVVVVLLVLVVVMMRVCGYRFVVVGDKDTSKEKYSLMEDARL